MKGAARTGLASLALGMLVGCATESVAVSPARKSAALTAVMKAEAEPERADSRAYRLRMQARREYEDATRAEAKGFRDEAIRRYDEAAADGELSLALARRDAWMAQAQERSAVLNQLRVLETSGGPSVTPGATP